MAIANQFDATRFYVSSIEDYGLLPNNASYDPLPPMPWGRKWPQHIEGKGFSLVEDHRARPSEVFGKDLAQKATPWWLPDDKFGTPAREMKTAGPLPADARLKAPEQTVSEAQTAKRMEINSGFDAALAASLTMPSINTPPSAVEVAVGAAALAAVDADGPAYIMQTHSARRATLMAAVDAATTAEAVQAITVSYAV